MIKILDFYADWCGPCKMVEPILKQIGEENPHITIEKINVDVDGDKAQAKAIGSIPTLIFEVDGVEKRRVVGYMPKAKIEEIIKGLVD